MGFFTGSRTSASPSSCSNNFLVSTDRNDDLHSPFPVCRKVIKVGGPHKQSKAQASLLLFFMIFTLKKEKSSQLGCDNDGQRSGTC